MAPVIENEAVPRSDESQLVAEDRTLAVAVDTRPILEAALAKQKLIELKLLTLQQWDAAAEAVGTQHDLVPILAELQQMEASWNSGCDEQFPVLTPFQVQKILAGKPEELWLDHYILLEKLGSGGMGDVFKARNTRLPRLEAIKTIHTASADGDRETSLGLERFQREAQLLAQLHHPHLTTIFHAGHDRDVQFIAIEYVRGKNLKQFVDEHYRDGRHMPVGRAVDYMITVAEVLAHAHERGVIHRDVKPANIMVTADGGLKVLDLGIAQLRDPKAPRKGVSSQLTQGAVSLGTPEVMAPEQWADAQSVTAASDIYSLGCTLFYLLTGRMPFIAESREELLCAVISAERPNASDFRAEVPPELSAVLRTMLAHYPQDRYQSAAEVIDALLPFADRITTSPLADTSRLKRKARISALAAAVMGALAVVAVAGWRQSSTAPQIDQRTLAVAKQVDTELGHPFQNLAAPAPPLTAVSDADKVRAVYEYRVFLNTAEQLLKLQSDPLQQIDGNLDVQVLVNGKPSKTVFADNDGEIAADERATIRVRARSGGYLTMLVFAADGQRFLLHWTKPLPEEQWLTVLEPEASSPGDDRLVLFLTQTDPLQGLPERPAAADQPRYDDSRDDLAQGLVVAAYTPVDLQQLENAFSKPHVFREVMDKLETGKPYPFAERQKVPATWWARKSFTLQVVDRTTGN